MGRRTAQAGSLPARPAPETRRLRDHYAASIAAGCVALLWFGWRERFWLPPVIPSMFLPGLLLFRETITARFTPTNWLERQHRDLYPVRLASPTTLKIEWNVVPGFRVLFAFLAPHVRILTTASVREDYAKLELRGRKDQETRLIELVEMGETMAAVRIARKIYGLDLAEARQFVDGLIGRNNA